MNVYTTELKLAKTRSNIKLEDYKAQIEEAACMYNKAGEAAVNKKSMELLEIKSSSILLRLRSETQLNAVGKALRFFSQQMVNKIPALAGNITSSGQLFRANPIGLPTTEEIQVEIPLKIKEIDDAELIKELVDYVCRKRDPNTSVYLKKAKAVEKMKQLAVEAGMLSI